MEESKQSENATGRPRRYRWAALETLLILALFFLFAGSPPPDVNEAHYLGKAKHFWNPDWCPGDHFLGSADAHLVFNWTFGWLTLLLPLPAVAWVGRLITWSLLAWAWQRLSFAIATRRLLSVLSAGLFLLFIQRCHMAGEWIVGGVEAKGFSYVLVLLGMEAIVRGRWRAVWLLLGAASAFHVLVGGWAVVAAVFAWLLSGKERLPLLPMLPWMSAGFVLCLPGLLPAIALTWGADSEVVRQANHLYLKRLGHHLVFLWFEPQLVLLHLNLVIFWLLLCSVHRASGGTKRLNGFVGGAVVIAVAGIAVDYLTVSHPDVAAALLRFYWFRPTDAYVPMGAALMTIVVLVQLAEFRPAPARWCGAAAMVAVCVNLSVNCYRRWQQDFRPRAVEQSHAQDPFWNETTFQAWVRVCHWIRDNTPKDARFITPPGQQTFNWYAARSEVVTRKDIPQNATAIVEWHRRLEAVSSAYRLGEYKILEVAHNPEYDAQYILWDRHALRNGQRVRSLWPLGLEKVYPGELIDDAPYEVYWIAPPLDE